MKLSLIVSTVLAVLIVSISTLVALDKQVPSEFLVVFASVSSYFVGMFSHNPLNKENENEPK